MKKIFSIFLLLSLAALASPISIEAQRLFPFIQPTWNPQAQLDQSQMNTLLSRFNYYHTFEPINSTTPLVAEVPVTNTTAGGMGSTIALLEVETNTFQSWDRTRKEKLTPYKVLALSGNKETNDINLYDGNSNTYTEFPVLAENNQSTVVQRIVYDAPITTDTLNLQFDPYTKPPTSISLKTKDNGQEYIVISEKQFSPSDLTFPAHTAAVWEVTLKYGQPLRINEASLIEQPSVQALEEYVRFLMKPGLTYRIYSQPDGYVSIPSAEGGNLLSAQNTIKLSLPPGQNNPLHTPPDDDKDRIQNAVDNCPDVKNPDQVDKNKNNIGDACEDFDLDGIMNSVDNCPDQPNRYQQDSDGDGIGDACDVDESRLTEQFTFLPWLGIGLGFGVVIFLFAVTKKNTSNISEPTKKSKS